MYSPEGNLEAVNFQMEMVQKMFFTGFSTWLGKFYR
jgi:hypothetical protein